MMLWSVQFIGRPDAVKRALDNYGRTLPSDEATVSFNRSRTALDLLIDLNQSDINLSASGNDAAVQVILMPSSALHVQ